MQFHPLKELITKGEIESKVKEMAKTINRDYAGKDLVIVMVLKGAICLVSDLIRSLDIPFELEAVQCSSYGSHGTFRGELQVWGLDRLKVHNRDLLIVDDIFDSGHTMAELTRAFQKEHPRSIRSCVLLNKNNVQKVTSLRPDYVLFEIDNLFIVGYGLDYKEQYRGLTGIYIYEEK
jgi:hypoxanthine phosphoribosyltransferase